MTRELPHVALSAHAHDREGMRRTDEDWIAERWADSSTRVLVLSGTRLRPVDGAVPPGRCRGRARRDAVAARPRRRRDPLRGDRRPGRRTRGEGGVAGPARLFPRVIAGDEALTAEVPWLFHAVGLAEWHWAHRFCPRCGGGLESTHAGHELRCASCGKSQFPRTDPAVIMAITLGEPGSEDERILLGRNASWPEKRFSTLAGFCEPGETPGGRRAPRGDGGDGRPRRRGRLLRQPAPAAALEPDARLHRAGAERGDRRRRHRGGGGAMVQPCRPARGDRRRHRRARRGVHLVVADGGVAGVAIGRRLVI
ncbi:NADH pyrophosphatase zinc ribbon domain-containing protein [Nocardioides sp. B-3]|uniref:NADH pyrophosphatase zinc ribbon domain-containing protein n=1 Tax=Nocardioides sp. B-3 TaxID=2895565 RepID=UPI003FA59DCC